MNLGPHPVTLRQLQYLVAVADRKSFRKAATDCHVSQPSLSAQIAQAEDALGIRVFERDRRHVLVTPGGASVVHQARELLLSMDELVTSAARSSDPFTGTLRLGVIPTIGPYLLPDLAPRLRTDFPNLTQFWVEDKTETLMARLREGELEGALVALEASLGKEGELDRVVLGEDPFVFASSLTHRLGRGNRRIRPEDLDGESLLLLDDGHCFREQALQFCSKAGVDEMAVRATSLPTLAQMAASGAGATLLPSLAVDVENRRGTLRIRRFAGTPPNRTIALVWRHESALEPTLRPVAETMRKVYRRLAH